MRVETRFFFFFKPMLTSMTLSGRGMTLGLLGKRLVEINSESSLITTGVNGRIEGYPIITCHHFHIQYLGKTSVHINCEMRK